MVGLTSGQTISKDIRSGGLCLLEVFCPIIGDCASDRYAVVEINMNRSFSGIKAKSVTLAEVQSISRELSSTRKILTSL